MSILQKFNLWLQEVARLPWKHVAFTLRARIREDRLSLTASSLTFSTIVAIVPFMTVVLAVFTAFPMFADFQIALQKWFVSSLVPDNIARQVLGYLNQFAGKASRLGAMGLVFLFISALALVFTIDRTLNSIWRVRRPRPLGQRVLIYWAVITLGPLLLGASLSLTSYAVSVSSGLVSSMPGGLTFTLDGLEFLLVAAGMAAMFRYVPNVHVRWGHAWMGGLFVSIGLEVGKKILSFYLKKVPTYSLVYGAFATVPILLIWIYMAWLLVLLGAALTAWVPVLQAGRVRMRSGPGWQFELALEILKELDLARAKGEKGLRPSQICQKLELDSLRLEPVLEALMELDWLGLLAEENAGGDNEARCVILVNPEQVTLEPLMQRLLLAPGDITDKLWKMGRWPSTSLREAL